MQQAQQTTTLKDAWGVEHTYSTIPFGFRKGMRLLRALMGGVGQVTAKVAEGERPDDKVGSWGVQFGLGLGEFAKWLLEQGDDEFIAELLSNTKRSEKQGGKGKREEKWANLGDLEELDRIGAANYLEIGEALIWVISVNWLPFGQEIMSDMKASLGSFVAAARGSLIQSMSASSEPASESSTSSDSS